MPFTAYKHDYKFIEDGFGEASVRFVVSDAFEGLFSASAITCNVLHPLFINDIIETYDGTPGVNELIFELNEAAIMNIDDADALNFTIEALDSSQARYCGVFFNPGAQPEIDDMKFCGKIIAESENRDLLWRGDEFSPNVNALKIRRFRAEPLIECMFNSVTIKDLIYGNQGDIEGIGSDWESANVADRQGWFLRGERSVSISSLVSLNALLEKFADILSSALYNIGFGDFNIVFDRSEIDGKFVPARWSHIVYKNSRPRYVFSRETSDISPRPYALYADDARQLVIGANAEPYETIWLNYRLVKPSETDEYNPTLAKDFAFENISSFASLIYILAETFGMFVKLYFSDLETIHIKFIGRSGAAGSEIFLRAAESASAQVSGSPLQASKLYTGKSFYMAESGNDAYTCNNCDIPGTYIPSENYTKGINRRRLPLTISPTQCSVNCKALDDGEAFTLARIPHNHYFTESGVRKNKVYSGAVSLHTGIYMFVDKRTGAEDESDSYWTPAAKFIIEIDGEDCGFDRLSEYLNFLKKRDLSFLSNEYIIRIPGWNCFSDNPNGEGQSWKLLEPGVRITLDGADYLVAGERMNLQYPERVITLFASGRFENICLSSAIQIEQPEPIVPISYSSDMQRRIHIANETLTAGNAVSLMQDGRVEKALPVHSHYGRLYGIALSGASAGEELEVQTGNRVFVKDWGLQRGAKYYLRKNAVSLSNISPEPLYEKTDTETMFACLGIAESSETLNIESGMYQQYLFE